MYLDHDQSKLNQLDQQRSKDDVVGVKDQLCHGLVLRILDVRVLPQCDQQSAKVKTEEEVREPFDFEMLY